MGGTYRGRTILSPSHFWIFLHRIYFPSSLFYSFFGTSLPYFLRCMLRFFSSLSLPIPSCPPLLRVVCRELIRARPGRQMDLQPHQFTVKTNSVFEEEKREEAPFRIEFVSKMSLFPGERAKIPTLKLSQVTKSIQELKKINLKERGTE